MKNRGFTVLEVLVAIMIMGVLSSLTYQAYFRSNRSIKEGERRADQLVASIQFIELVSMELEGLLYDHPAQFKSDKISFKVRNGMVFEDVEVVQSEPDSAHFSRKASGDSQPKMIREYLGQVGFKFWDGANWLTEWNNENLPVSVCVSVTPEGKIPSKMEPFSLTVDIPCARHCKNLMTRNTEGNQEVLHLKSLEDDSGVEENAQHGNGAIQI